MVSEAFDRVLAELNPAQREAASTTTGTLFISAGAGTGKTKTLTAHYVACILAMLELNPESTAVDRVLAITYTNAAAAELAERVKKTLRSIGRDDVARQMGDAWISTMHAFCLRVLRSEAPQLRGIDALDPAFTTLDALEATALRAHAIDAVFDRWARDDRSRLRALLSEKSRSAVERSIGDILSQRAVWGYGADAVVVPTDPGDSATWRERSQEVASAVVDMSAEAHDRYEELKRERAALDYGDLILRVKRLFETNPVVAERYRTQFGRIIIDEFQDTNRLQYAVFQAIASDNLSIVGDKNQSIYAFQGAQAEVFDLARADVERADGGLRLELGSNYRSHADVLNFANAAFTSTEMFGEGGLVRLEHARDEAREGVDTLAAAHPDSRLVLAPILGSNKQAEAEDAFLSMGAAEREAVWIADWVERLHKHHDPPVPLADIKVVVRARTSAGIYAAELRSRGIPAFVVGGTGLLNDATVRATLALVRVIDNPANESALTQLLISPFGRVPDQTLADLRFATQERMAKSDEPDRDCGLWSAIGQWVADGAAGGDLADLFAAVSRARESLGAVPLDAVLLSVVAQRGVDLMLLGAPEGSSQSELELRQSYENLMRFIEMAGTWDRTGGSARGFISEIESLIEQKETLELPLWSDGSEGGEVVSIMTIHATKGLEFPVVIFPTTAWGVGPKSEGACRVSHVQESRAAGGAEGQGEIWVTASVNLVGDEPARAKSLVKTKAADAADFALKTAPGRYVPLPHRVAAERREEAELREARRLMYVAVTRARDMLIVGHRVDADEPAPGATPATGAQVWHAMVRDRFIDGDYPDYSLQDARYPFELTLDRSMLTSAEYSDAHEQGEVRGSSRMGAGLSGGDFGGEPGPGNAGAGHCEAVIAPGARHLELEVRRAVHPNRLSQVSASHLSVFRRCPRLYYLQYLAGAGTLRNKNPNDEANRGNALHAIVEMNWSTEVLDLERAERVLRAHRIDAEYHPEVLAQAAALLSAASLSELRGSAYTVQVERQFYEHIAGDERTDEPAGSVCLQGYIDAIAIGPDGSVRVLDYKSGKGADREHYRTQADCYALVGLKLGAPHVDVRFLMPGASAEELSERGDVETDGAIPYYQFRYAPDDRARIEAEILGAVSQMVESGDVGEADLEAHVSFSTCMACGFRGPLCGVGARRKRS